MCFCYRIPAPLVVLEVPTKTRVESRIKKVGPHLIDAGAGADAVTLLGDWRPWVLLECAQTICMAASAVSRTRAMMDTDIDSNINSSTSANANVMPLVGPG